MGNSKRHLGIGIAATVVIIVIVVFMMNRRGGDEPQVGLSPTPTPEGPCPGDTRTFKVTDAYMKGKFDEGAEVDAIMNFFGCNTLQKGDVVVYRFSMTLDPVIRVVRAAPGDSFKLIQDKANKRWNLEVNGDLLEVDGQPYAFGGEMPPTMSLYEKSRNGKLGPMEAIVLSMVPPGDKDSSVFGVVNLKDLIAKVKTN